MSVVEDVQSAANPQQALLAIAAALDRIDEKLLYLGQMADAGPDEGPVVDPWAGWRGVAVLPPASLNVTETDDEITVTLAPVSGEEAVRRCNLAAEMQLDEQLGDGDGKLEYAYSKGGPLWLYLSSSEGRDYILGLPLHMKREMVADVKAHHTQRECEEFARDVLKASTDEQQGSAAQISEENVINRSVTNVLTNSTTASP